MAGLQAQYAPAMYIGVWSRLEGFERADLAGALEKRTVVQGTLLRSTIHLVSAEDYWPFALAVREERRRWWLGATHRPGAEDMVAAAERLRAHLEEHGTARRKEVDEIVGKERTNGVGLWVDLVRVPPSGTWERRRADLYALAEDWLGPPPADLDAEKAVSHVVRRYLEGFGPAAPAEIANWAGLRTGSITTALDGLRLRRFQTETGDELVDLPRAPLPDPDTAAPVRFLPTWDATLLAHARRGAIVPEEYRPRIFNTKTPHSVHTFLVDGHVAGTWRYDGKKVALDYFESVSAEVRREVEAEADRMAAFHS